MQDDIAFLLGLKGSSSVSRFERFAREPDFRSALAFEHILGAPVQKLFAPLFADVGRGVSERARERLDALQALRSDARHAVRLTHLGRLAEPSPTLFDV